MMMCGYDYVAVEFSTSGSTPLPAQAIEPETAKLRN
jgi:hypothetical protein